MASNGKGARRPDPWRARSTFRVHYRGGAKQHHRRLTKTVTLLAQATTAGVPKPGRLDVWLGMAVGDGGDGALLEAVD